MIDTKIQTKPPSAPCSAEGRAEKETEMKNVLISRAQRLKYLNDSDQ